MMSTFQLDQKTGRLAGFFYLLVAILGIYAEFGVRAQLIVPDNAGQTAQNIAQQAGLFRFGLAADIVCQLCHFVLVLILYYMFKAVNARMAAFMVACVIASVAMTLVNLTNSLEALFWLENTHLAQHFNTEQVQALSMMALKKHSVGYTIAGVFFGLWLYPLGALAQQSGRYPAILGILLKLGCLGYLIDTFVTVIVPAYKPTVAPVLAVAGIAELAFCLYLLIVGIRKA